MNLYFNIKNYIFNGVVVLGLMCGLVACGQADHEPRVGEYGEALVNSVLLTPSEIEALNKAEVTKPKASSNRPEVNIGFQGDDQKNPYRFVVVAKGSTIQEGQVDLKWIGGVQSEASRGYHPDVFQTDDNHRYTANYPVLLVVGSDPFSVSEKNNGSSYSVHAELMEVSNFQFQSVELQVWQGKASQYNWVWYLKFLLILMVVIFGVSRVISVRR